jgi:hypothetical protein
MLFAERDQARGDRGRHLVRLVVPRMRSIIEARWPFRHEPSKNLVAGFLANAKLGANVDDRMSSSTALLYKLHAF